MLVSSLLAILLASTALSAPVDRMQSESTTPPNSPANVKDWVKYNKDVAHNVASGAVGGIKTTAGSAKQDIKDGVHQIGYGIKGTTSAVAGGFANAGQAVGSAVKGSVGAAKDKAFVTEAIVAGKALNAKDSVTKAVNRTGERLKDSGLSVYEAGHGVKEGFKVAGQGFKDGGIIIREGIHQKTDRIRNGAKTRVHKTAVKTGERIQKAGNKFGGKIINSVSPSSEGI
ncbi:hypothetical protein FRB97_002652 [Tulasnella sp. 331]|nr:hypothetical protein FRB97_002652 [Tulasnella sp. 331]KAG8883366.1 hypothetical protein FRB98_003138 [Tulasnella sp. 332]